MGVTWYFLGLVTTGAAIFLWHFSKRYRLNWLTWSGLILGIFLILFSIAWAVGSVLEGVPRAASMGLLLFGLSGIVILTFTLRYTFAKREKLPVPEAEPAGPVEAVTPAPQYQEKKNQPELRSLASL